MTDLFTSLVNRALDRAPVLQRRRPTLFEPPAEAALGEQAKTEKASPLEENEIVVESRPSPVEQRHSVSNSLISPQLLPPFAQPEPEPLDVGPARPRRVRDSRQAQADHDNDRMQPVPFVPVKEATKATRPESPSNESNPAAIAKAREIIITPAREIETIVESRVEREIIREHSTDQPSIREVRAIAQTNSEPKSSRDNDGAQPKQSSQAELKQPASKEQTLIKPAIRERPARPRQVSRPAVQPASLPRPDELSRPAPPVIHVTIGRVEVRATSQAPIKVQPAQPAGPKMSLEDYLRSRGKRN